MPPLKPGKSVPPLLLNHMLSINISNRYLLGRRNGLFKQQVWTKTARSAPGLVEMVKAVAKRMVASAVLRLPWGARETIYEALCGRLGTTETMARAAARAGITGVSASGRWGTIQSAASDRAILPTYARTGDWARRTHGALAEFFSDAGGTYLDIGANIGLTTIPVARNPLVNCFAFEPEPTNFANLQENVQRNTMHKNVVLHRLALLDRAGFVPFGLSSDGNLGDHRVVTAVHCGRRTIEVAAVPLDTLRIPITGQLAIKVDTQDAEPAVISGGMRTFANANLVILEFSPYMIDQLHGDPAIMYRYLADFDRVALVKGESGQDLSFSSAIAGCMALQKIYETCRHDKSAYFDVYARRNAWTASYSIH